MPSVVIDRSVILPALCSPKSKYRALLALLDYGRLVTFLRFGAEEWDDVPSNARLGGPSYNDLRAQAEARKSLLDEQLGHVTEEWSLVVSDLVLETYEGALRDHSEAAFGIKLEPYEILALSRKVLLTASLVVPPTLLLPL